MAELTSYYDIVKDNRYPGRTILASGLVGSDNEPITFSPESNQNVQDPIYITSKNGKLIGSQILKFRILKTLRIGIFSDPIR
jgi:hypothetical protein